MLVSDSHKFTMHHFPKTAGTSRSLALSPYIRHPVDIVNPVPSEAQGAWQLDEKNFFRVQAWRHHEDFWIHQAVKGTRHITIGEDYFQATFVRNPFSLIFASWDGDEEFPDFVKYFVATGQVPPAWRTQLDFISDDHGNILVDWIGRFENLLEDWDIFTTKVGLEGLKLPKQNMSTDDFQANRRKKSEDYVEHYNSYAIDAVAKKFREDLDFFGYEFGQ